MSAAVKQKLRVLSMTEREITAQSIRQSCKPVGRQSPGATEWSIRVRTSMASVDANWSATNVPRMRTNRARSSITIQQLHAIECTGGKAGISSLILGRSRGLGARIRLERKPIRARYRG